MVFPLWECVREANSLAKLNAQKTYRAGNNFNYDKSLNYKIQWEKQITEENTGATGTVKIITLESINNINLSFIKRLKMIGRNILPLLFLVSITSFLGCSTNGHLTRRYKSHTYRLFRKSMQRQAHYCHHAARPVVFYWLPYR